MPKAKEPLPGYNKPPVNEVVIGVQFDKLKKFTAVHPGLYWQRIKDRYPQCSFHPPIAPLKETFESTRDLSVKKHLQLSSTPPLPRCWFLDGSGNQLVQLQPERFLHNWRKVTGKESYPRYNTILPEFERLWKDFLDFAASESLDEVKPNHWEVTYINHIYQGEVWTNFGDIHKLFPFFSSKTSLSNLQHPERINLDLSYAFP
ncbi:MAG TPA: TIGR04255 family protein, partial [Planctomycetes bacterium]|nr:TIGR04255 family protein [Planctomycetota bacterium]